MEGKKTEMKSQVVNYLQSYFLGSGFQELNDLVIKNQNCVYCGTCASLCPRIEMNEKEPKLLENDPECSTCYRFCPRVYFPEDMFEKELFHGNGHENYSIGNYQKVYAAKSINEDVVVVTQNGGVVSTLLLHALDTGLIDGVLLTDRDDDWYPKPIIARSSDEILSCVGSKYTISPTLSVYADAINKYKLKKLAFVGMPCQIHAVRKLQLYSPLSDEFGKFTLVIGLYCYSNYTYDLMKSFVQKDLGVPLNDVKKFDVSGGKFFVYLKDGSIKKVPIKETKKYSWKSCQYCKDYSAELADISIGSVGALKNDWNSVLLRTDAGMKLFNETLESKKLISSQDLDFSIIEREALRKKIRVTKVDNKILNTLQTLNISDNEITTYTTLMSLGRATESILRKVMNTEADSIRDALTKLMQRDWVMSVNGTYRSVNPTLVLNNEIDKMRRNFLEKVENLKTIALPSLETRYAQNNFNNKQVN